MDGQMCEDIRIGIMVRTALIGDERGGMWRRIRDEHGNLLDIPSTWVTFSSTVLQVAGGIRRFLAEWEQEI